MTQIIHVKGMHCASCEIILEKELDQESGTLHFSCWIGMVGGKFIVVD